MIMIMQDLSTRSTRSTRRMKHQKNEYFDPCTCGCVYASDKVVFTMNYCACACVATENQALHATIVFSTLSIYLGSEEGNGFL